MITQILESTCFKKTLILADLVSGNVTEKKVSWDLCQLKHVLLPVIANLQPTVLIMFDV